MKIVLYVFFAAVFAIGWEVAGDPRVAKWGPDFASGFIAVVVMARIAARYPIALAPRYVVLGLLLILVMLASALVNFVQPGAVVYGLRSYLKHLPLLLLPAVVEFSDTDIRRLLKFILALLVLQAPVSLFQRFVYYVGVDELSGDLIAGTLGYSKILSIVLLCGLSVVWAFHLRGRIGLIGFGVLAMVLFLPTTINETTGTLFLLPFAIAIPLFAADQVANRARYVWSAGIGGALLIAMFSFAYNAQYSARWGGSIFNIFEGGRFLDYELRKGEGPKETRPGVGRIEGINVALDMLSNDVVKVLVGAGIGNVGEAPSKVLKGAYTEYDKKKMGVRETALAMMLWEMGVLGAVLFYAFLTMVWRDCWALRNGKDFSSALALGWLGVVGIMFVASMYTNMFTANPILYPFAFFSGFLMSRRSWAYRSRAVSN